MSAFEYLSVALSFVLGFGVTRLLLGAVSVFKSRRTRTPHWIPLVWAAAIFVYQLQFWWALFELNETIPVWTHVAFVTAMAHALLLFVAGALALPVSDNGEPATLIDYFEQDGRWALLAVSGHIALSFWTNWALFSTGPFTGVGVIVIINLAPPLIAFFVQSRRARGAIGVVALIFALYAYAVLAPAQY